MEALLSSTRKWIALAVIVCLIVFASVMAWTLYSLGGKAEEVDNAKAEAKATVKAANKATVKVRTDLARADATGQAREQDRARLDEFFDSLNREAADAPTTAADRYVLPDDRLRIWRDANGGRRADGQSTGQSDEGAAGAAAAVVGSDRNTGGEPSPGGEGLSPARVPDVPAADVSAATNGGL